MDESTEAQVRPPAHKETVPFSSVTARALSWSLAQPQAVTPALVGQVRPELLPHFPSAHRSVCWGLAGVRCTLDPMEAPSSPDDILLLASSSCWQLAGLQMRLLSIDFNPSSGTRSEVELILEIFMIVMTEPTAAIH